MSSASLCSNLRVTLTDYVSPQISHS